MALNERRTWLIGYDVAQPKRLRRVYRLLRKVAVPVQYSVFLAEETAQGIRRIRDELAALINPREDDVRIYLLPAHADVAYYGKRALPEGLLLLDADPVQTTRKLLRCEGTASGGEASL